MVAIVVAALSGAGVSTLLLAHSGLLVVVLAVPIAGSVAGLAAALCLGAARDRSERGRATAPSPTSRPRAITR